jgi:hypothetical protein
MRRSLTSIHSTMIAAMFACTTLTAAQRPGQIPAFCQAYNTEDLQDVATYVREQLAAH